MVGFFDVPAVMEGFAHGQVVVAGVTFDSNKMRIVRECIFGEPFHGIGPAVLTSDLLLEPDVEQAGRVLKIKKSEHANGNLVFVLNQEGFGSIVCVVTLLYGC